MRPAAAGLTTLECLVAIVVLAIGVLGTSATLGLAIRAAQDGTRAAAGARLLTSVLDSLGAAATADGCEGLAAGRDSGSPGVGVSWAFTPSGAGRQLRLLIAYPAMRGTHRDSAWGYLRCR